MTEHLELLLDRRVNAREVGRMHPRFGGDRHEIGVAPPARHEVNMKMLVDARPGRRAEVDADIEPLRLFRIKERERWRGNSLLILQYK